MRRDGRMAGTRTMLIIAPRASSNVIEEIMSAREQMATPMVAAKSTAPETMMEGREVLTAIKAAFLLFRPFRRSRL